MHCIQTRVADATTAESVFRFLSTHYTLHSILFALLHMHGSLLTLFMHAPAFSSLEMKEPRLFLLEQIVNAYQSIIIERVPDQGTSFLLINRSKDTCDLGVDISTLAGHGPVDFCAGLTADYK